MGVSLFRELCEDAKSRINLRLISCSILNKYTFSMLNTEKECRHFAATACSYLCRKVLAP